MLTRQEQDELVRLIAQYTEAWEDYVKDVAMGDPARYGSGAVVVERQEELKKYITKELA
jgi:hypothetical protein